jgi:hypothetical protein
MSKKVNIADAEYNTELIERYVNNPLIASLPPMANEAQITEFFMRLPKIYRNGPQQQRIAQCEDLFDVIIPTENYWPLYQIVYSMLFNSYANRNPLQPKTIKFQYNLALHKKEVDKSWERTTGGGCILLAASGFGKTTIFKRIFNFLPEVVNLLPFQGKELGGKQIVCIFLEIPSDGSRKGLMKLFFEKVDELVGTNYQEDYGKSTIAQFEPVFRQICSTFHVGLLIIDDIQNLRKSKGGDDLALLNFMSSLSNVIGVGIIKIGTPDASDLFETDFSPLRRSTTAGDYIIERYKETDNSWKTLVCALWGLQWTEKNTASSLAKYSAKGIQIIDKELFSLIYDYSQGIPYLLNFLFISAQKWAIRTGYEKLDRKSIEKGHFNSSSLIRLAVQEIRADNEGKFNDLIVKHVTVAKIEAKKAIEDLEKIVISKGFKGKSANELKKLYYELIHKYTLTDEQKKVADGLRRILENDGNVHSGPIVIDGDCKVIN